MNVQIVDEVLDCEGVINEMPLSERLRGQKAASDKAVSDVITGESGKFLVIIGPCSAHNEEAVIDYACRMSKLQKLYADKLVVAVRVYTNKPRTTGSGYKGLVHQPDPEKKPNLKEGILAIRRIHLHVLEQAGLPTADEMLYPENYMYLADLLSYVAVGARSSENQQHRLVASGIDTPVGIKNPTSGDINVMMNSIQAAQSGHEFIYRNQVIRSFGNPLAHAILRGAVNKHGESIPNYHYEDLKAAAVLYRSRNLQNPAIIVDANHDNSSKQYLEQPRIVKNVLVNRQWDETLHTMIKGLMIESFIEEGRQDIETSNVYGKSITDPCLGWSQTEELIGNIAESV
ncbi:MAG: 3-deoxy-7-phosphoheptulonate synthase [Firmicutes bacterium]|nr:3-deoxy-7-phosphoheptulonate synthase [Bacillota bacterium]